MKNVLILSTDVMWKIISDIASEYGATLERDIENCGKNRGASAGKYIFLGEFDDPQIELIAFFHELGHVTSDIGEREYFMTKLSQEGMAWEVGLTLAKKHGFAWDYDCDSMKWARKQLFTYVDDLEREVKNS
jgi:hypothetical protein